MPITASSSFPPPDNDQGSQEIKWFDVEEPDNIAVFFITVKKNYLGVDA